MDDFNSDLNSDYRVKLIILFKIYIAFPNLSVNLTILEFSLFSEATSDFYQVYS